MRTTLFSVVDFAWTANLQRTRSRTILEFLLPQNWLHPVPLLALLSLSLFRPILYRFSRNTFRAAVFFLLLAFTCTAQCLKILFSLIGFACAQGQYGGDILAPPLPTGS